MCPCRNRRDVEAAVGDAPLNSTFTATVLRLNFSFLFLSLGDG